MQLGFIGCGVISIEHVEGLVELKKKDLKHLNCQQYVTFRLKELNILP